MELKLILEQTGETWILKPNRVYVIGSEQDCNIVLPATEAIAGCHLEISFDSLKQGWQIRNLSPYGAFVNTKRIDVYVITQQTRIGLTENIALIATPIEASTVSVDHQTTSNTSTRLISGTAYRLGMREGFSLLNFLRSDPYKAKSPEASLNLDEIATHAAQSVALSLVCVGAVFLLWLFHILILLNNFGITGIGFLFLSPVTVFDTVCALIIAGELVYLRWAIARRFLKNRHRHNFRVEFLAGLTNFLKQRVLQAGPHQNTIVFGGFKPFLGAGKPISTSDITIAIPRKSDNSLEKDEFVKIPTSEFYRAIDEEVARLKLPNLQILSQLLVSGFELASDGDILIASLSRPSSVLPEDKVWQLGHGDLSSNRRAYRVYRYVDTERDNVLSYFIRFHNVGSVTFVEGVAYGLTSFNRKHFSLTPVLKDTLITRLFKMLLLAALLTPFKLYFIPTLWQTGIFLSNLLMWWSNDLAQRRAAKLQEEYNYGRVFTFREAIASPFDVSYYGNQDLVMYWKFIQQAIFKGTIAVLKQYKVDTSQFEQTITAITNYGVMVTGGQLNANQVTAGRGAQAILKTVQGFAASAVGMSQPNTQHQVGTPPNLIP